MRLSDASMGGIGILSQFFERATLNSISSLSQVLSRLNEVLFEDWSHQLEGWGAAEDKS